MSRKSGEDEDLDIFKSIVVKDDMREDFFEALEKSPKIEDKQIRFSDMEGIQFDLEDGGDRLNKFNNNEDESFVSCNNEFQ